MLPPSYSNLPTRFWDKVEVQPSGCWEWQAALNHRYGHYGDNGKGHRAHRLSAADRYGEIPFRKYVLHHCDNPPCVNPRHLYFGTQQDNINDAIERGRLARGERSGPAKLNEQQVIALRGASAKGQANMSLAAKYGITPRAVRYIVSRNTWRHLND